MCCHTQMLIQQQQAASQQSHMQSPQPSQSQQNQLQPSLSQQNQLQPSLSQQNQLQPSLSQQNQLQPPMSQQNQLQPPMSQQNQLQPSMSQQNQLQPSMSQQNQLQPSMSQQNQLQPSQLQQSQLHPAEFRLQLQLQQLQAQRLHLQLQQLQAQGLQVQLQLQQSQLQQSQIQKQSENMQQQSQHQGVTAAMSMGSSVEQSNMNVTSSVPINVATINVSQPQQLQTIQQNVNTSYGTPVQMAVSRLTALAQTLPAETMMSQSSGPHPTMVHPTMTMAQAPLQQHAYSPHQQMLYPGNLTLQHAALTTSTLQGLNNQGLSLQSQAKTTLDPKTSGGQNIQAINTGNKAFQNQPAALQTKSLYSSTMPVHPSTLVYNGSHFKQISSQPQIVTTQASGTKFTQAQLLGSQALSPLPPGNCLQTSALQLGKNPIISRQSDMIIQQSQPQTAMHLPVAASAQSVPPTSFASANVAPQMQKQAKAFQNQPAALQPKSLYSSTMPVHTSTLVYNGSHFKQISSQPQIVTSQASGTKFTQAQLLGSQALSSLPPGNCLQTSALQRGQNPIISQQSDLIIQQTQPQTAMHLPVAASAQPVPPTSFASANVAPQKQKQVETFQNQPAALQPKSLYSSSMPVHPSTLVYNGSHFKQISSQPQIVASRTSRTKFTQAQLQGSQALSPLPPGNCLQTSALQLGQNPIISQQSDMIIQQTQPQTAMHLPVAASAQPVPPTSFASETLALQKQKLVKECLRSCWGQIEEIIVNRLAAATLPITSNGATPITMTTSHKLAEQQMETPTDVQDILH